MAPKETALIMMLLGLMCNKSLQQPLSLKRTATDSDMYTTVLRNFSSTMHHHKSPVYLSHLCKHRRQFQHGLQICILSRSVCLLSGAW